MKSSPALPLLTITRRFEAPVELVYRLWTDPDLMKRWWGIKGSTVPVCELDVRPGGKWRIEMRTADGTIYPNAGEYLEVVPNQRLVYTDVPDPAITEWNGDPPQVRRNRVHFDDRNGVVVLVTLEIEFANEAERERMLGFGMQRGIEQSLDRLEELIASIRASPT